MNKNTPTVVIIAIVFLLGLMFYFVTDKPAPVGVPVPEDTSIVYKNTEYGFNFSLPLNWQGYSIIENKWEGTTLKDKVASSGPKFLIRNPKWTATAPYQDLPIMVFTISQWDSYVAEDFSVSAAPIPASELGRNNRYVFALPPRWDFDYSIDYKEAQDIMASKPLQTFDVVEAEAQGKLNIKVVCEQALAYMTFPDAKSAEVFVSECVEGKHPEVVQKYKADLNLGTGATI